MDPLGVKHYQERLWSAQVEHYQRVIEPLFAPIAEALIERAQLWEGELVLDVGTGAGALGLRAAQRVGETGEVAGIDLSPAMVEAAARRAQAEGVENFLSHVGDAEKIPFLADTFDVVLSGLTYMLCPEPYRAFGQAHRVLKENGRLVFAVWGRPERCAFHEATQILAESLPAQPGDLPSPFGLADVDTLWTTLNRAGFRPAVEALDFPFTYDDVRTLLDVHAPAARLLLSPDEYERAAELLAARFAGERKPLRLSNEIVFAIGYR